MSRGKKRKILSFKTTSEIVLTFPYREIYM